MKLVDAKIKALGFSPTGDVFTEINKTLYRLRDLNNENIS